MFANPLYSVAILLALVLIYRFIISPRLRVRFAETYSHIDGFWARLWARLWAFRTPVVAALGPVFTALPDIFIFIWNVLLQFILAVPTIDLSSWLPQPWPAYAMGASTFTTIIMKAFETKPDGVKAA
jgi:hypothetical protein